ncbi:hypothetical protein NT6N_18980 [Oceaniferula spumae]|uniref:Uncharacterized protein n=1 Tax=Oceaniferula spumae TaxID=2979115 RepID=A0AAT9FLP6_9BACT
MAVADLHTLTDLGCSVLQKIHDLQSWKKIENAVTFLGRIPFITREAAIRS